MAAPPAQPTVLTFEEARRVVEEQASQDNSGRHRKARPAPRRRTSSRRAHHRRPRHPSLPALHARWLRRPRSRSGNAPSQAKVIGEIKAGPLQVPSQLNRGEAFSIMTGAPGTAGRRRRRNGRIHIAKRRFVEITRGIAPGENIVAQGAEAKRGSLLLDRGTRLNEAAIALAASVGKSRLQVFVRPRIAVLDHRR